MIISYNWLKELIDIKLAADELAAALTRVGLAVEGIHPHGDDLIFDIDLTSNRPDCLSHLGVAREISVIADRGLRIADSESQYLDTDTRELVKIEDPDLCHRFTARIIRNVKVGPSPKWLADRLESLGERSINNVADITNHVMLELGQPMHAFDLDKLAGNRIVVRRAKSGERIMTLKELECELDDSVLAICDAEKPVAIGGVVGGLDSSITDKTVNVLLEVAYFKRESIKSTSRRLGLATEASYRFERGVDIENLIRASNRATELIIELADGEAAEFVDLYPAKRESVEIESRDISAAVQRLTGLVVDAEKCRDLLESLGIQTKSKSEISNLKSQILVAPSWRHDLTIEEDLVEEIARHTGYDKIEDRLPPAFGAGEYRPDADRRKRLRLALADMGFSEAMSYSFIDTRFDEMFVPVPGLADEKAAEKYVTLQDSVIEGALRMRPTLLPGLLETVRLNLNHQRRDIRLFEMGKVFAGRSGEDGLPAEREVLSLVITGGESLEARALAARETDLYDAKGAIEAALDALGIVNAGFRQTQVSHLRPGQTAEVTVGGMPVGSLGRLSDDIAAEYKFKQPVFLAELDLSATLASPQTQSAFQPLPKYPAIVRDVSFLAKRSSEFTDIRGAILEQGMDLCKDVMFADIYEGKGLAADERSVTVRIVYRSDERTLLEQEVEDVHGIILEGVEKRLGIRPRV